MGLENPRGSISSTLYSTRGLEFERRWWWAAAAAALLGLLATAPARADLLFDALASTYVTNPNLNAARAAVRGADEDVPQALSGYRPTVGLTADLGVETDRSTTNGKWSTPLYPRGLAFTVEQPIFRGFQTKNSVGAAESSVKATREQLRGIEQETLLNAVQPSWMSYGRRSCSTCAPRTSSSCASRCGPPPTG